MRFDALYILSSVWGGLTGSQICTSIQTGGGVGRALESRSSAAITAFVDVNVVPMDTERVLPNQTVIVVGDRITVLGPVRGVKVPDGASRIDGRGKYLIPGLADMHVHDLDLNQGAGPDYPPEPFLFTQIAGGVTTIRYLTFHGRDHMERFRRSKVVEEKLSPHVYFAENFRGFMQPGLAPDSVAAAYKTAGYNFLMLEKKADTLPGLKDDPFIQAARRLGLPFASHNHSALVEVVGAHSGSVEHLHPLLPASSYDSIRGGHGKSEAEIRALARTAQRAGIWVTPTLACHEYTAVSSAPDILSAVGPQGLATQRRLVKALHEVGVRLLLGAEGAYAISELAALVRAGLTPYQALLTGTRNAAQYMNLTDHRGTVAIGKIADLVLLNGNPLADIEHVREPAGVMIQGRWFDRAALDQGLLAFPRAWFRRVWGTAYEDEMMELSKKISPHVRTLVALADSLKAATPTDAERVRRLLAAELGATRRALAEKYPVPTGEMQKNFDVIARAWMREGTRKGHQIPVAGVSAP